MNEKKLLELGLTEEQAKAVLEGYKGYVPLERFNEVNEAKKNAESLVAERDKQIESLKKSAGDNEALKAEIEKLQGENKAAKEKYDSDIKTLKINNAIDSALTTAGAKNLKAARALIDFEKIKIDAEGVKGVEEQIKALVSDESTSFMFKGSTPPTGTKAGESNKGTDKPYSQMNYSERVAYLAAGGKPE